MGFGEGDVDCSIPFVAACGAAPLDVVVVPKVGLPFCSVPEWGEVATCVAGFAVSVCYGW